VCLSEIPLEWYAEFEKEGNIVIRKFSDKYNENEVEIDFRGFMVHKVNLYCSGTDNRGQQFTASSEVFIAGNDFNSGRALTLYMPYIIIPVFNYHSLTPALHCCFS